MFNRKYSEGILIVVSSICLLYLGLYFRSLYFFNAGVFPQFSFWASLIIFSVSTIFLWNYFDNFSYYLVLILGFCTIFSDRYFLRFFYFSKDLVVELSVSKITGNLGRIPTELIGVPVSTYSVSPIHPGSLVSAYYSTISVTVLPNIISEVTGLPLIDVYRLVVPIITVASAMLVFLIVRNLFSPKIAILATLLYSIDVSNPFLRQDIAVFFFFLGLFFIFRKNRTRRGLIISIVCLAVIPISHYGTFYFVAFALISILVAGWLLRQRRISFIFRTDEHVSVRHIISVPLVLLFIVIGFTWLFFVGLPILSYNLSEIRGSILAIFHTAVIQSSPFEHRVLSSSQGPITTFTEWFERLLAVAGMGLTLKVYRNFRIQQFAILGGFMLALLIPFLTLPNLANAIDLDRILGFSLVTYEVFVVIALLSMSQRLHAIGKLIPVIAITLILIGVINLPIMYTSSASISRAQNIYDYSVLNGVSYDQMDFQFASWIGVHTSQLATFGVDNPGTAILDLANRVNSQVTGQNSSDLIHDIQSRYANYFVELSYVSGYLQYSLADGNKVQFNSSEINSIFNNQSLNRVYDNSKDILYSYT